ncbi:MAG: class I SAM-dependent methyltransferase [Acidimicrobiia bacterium]
METGPTIGDAFGLALLDYLEHGEQESPNVIERDDGMVEVIDTGVFFDGGAPWSSLEESVPDRAGRRVLDVGAGAGRHSLVLQEADHDVLALDISPGAVEVCSRRGVQHTFEGSIFDLAGVKAEPFDTFLLCGHNYGLLASPEHAPKFLGTLARWPHPEPKSSGRA